MKKMPVLIPFLVFVSALFIGILIWAYVETKKANPQMIEVGQAGPEGAPPPMPASVAGFRPLASGMPSGPGCDRSHDRQGVERSPARA